MSGPGELRICDERTEELVVEDRLLTDVGGTIGTHERRVIEVPPPSG